MADKSKMKCNSPKRSDRPQKKKMVKACANGKEKLIHYGQKGYKHNYSKSAKSSLELVMDAIKQKIKCLQSIGLVKTYGQEAKRLQIQVLKKELIGGNHGL